MFLLWPGQEYFIDLSAKRIFLTQWNLEILRSLHLKLKALHSDFIIYLNVHDRDIRSYRDSRKLLKTYQFSFILTLWWIVGTYAVLSLRPRKCYQLDWKWVGLLRYILCNQEISIDLVFKYDTDIWNYTPRLVNIYSFILQEKNYVLET